MKNAFATKCKCCSQEIKSNDALDHFFHTNIRDSIKSTKKKERRKQNSSITNTDPSQLDTFVRARLFARQSTSRTAKMNTTNMHLIRIELISQIEYTMRTVRNASELCQHLLIQLCSVD